MGETATNEAQTGALRPGLVIADKYRLKGRKGEGAMGSVWHAEHVTLGHNVAIKFLHGSVASAPDARARFEREAKVAARLGEASRHITRVMDHGVTPEGTPFLVMELLQGEGLEVMLKRERRLPISLVAKIVSQLCKALHVAHQAGVIHRDLKPANVFLTHSQDDGDYCVKLLDFGVAKAAIDVNDEEDPDTQSGALVGTPNYMSPEQISGDREIDPRSDLFAVAAIAYRMAVGRAPFGSGALNELAMRITQTEAPTPSTLAPDLPPEFDQWVVKGLAKQPEDRYQNARELAETLVSLAGGASFSHTGHFPTISSEHLAFQSGDSVGGLQVTDWGRRSAVAFASAPAKKKKSRVLPIAALALIACGIVGFAVLRTRLPGRGTNAAASPPATTTASPSASAANAQAPSASEATSTATAGSVQAPTPSASETAAPGATSVPSVATAAPTTTFRAAPTAGAATTAAPTATATASATAPEPPPAATVDPKQKGGDLWKKTDEM
jgi:serine/threonine-protein kinase